MVNDTKPTVKSPWFWIRDTRGHGSVTVTFVFIAFVVTTIAYALSIFQKIGPFEIRPFDVAACGAYFVPLLSLYFGRKLTDAKYSLNGNGNGTSVPPPKPSSNK